MTLNKTAIAAIISLAALTGFSGVTSAQNTVPAGQQTQSTNQGMDNCYHMNNARHQGGRMANLTPEQQATSQKAFDEFEAKTAAGLNPDPFLMAVALGAASDFLTPIGHQCNTLVMGPAGYRFGDYTRLGLPLSILMLLAGVPLIAFFWPLAPH